MSHYVEREGVNASATPILGVTSLFSEYLGYWHDIQFPDRGAEAGTSASLYNPCWKLLLVCVY